MPISPRHRQSLACRCAGICYPREAAECLNYFRDFFDQPPSVPWPVDFSDLTPLDSFRGVLSPHIDFRVSTAAYSHAFAAWLQAPLAEVYLILGVGHHARQEWSIDGRPYLTPLGPVEVEAEMAAHLIQKCPFPLGDPLAHEGEHSIEFPLVLLQALRRLRGVDRPFTFLPVLCGGQFEAVELGQAPPPAAPLYHLAGALREIWQHYGPRVQLIVSIDGCHIGPRFGHSFFVDKKALKACAAWEKGLWALVEKSDLPGFFAYLGRDRNARYFDGVGALSLVMAMFGSSLALERRHYEQWFEPRDASVVSFTSGVFTNVKTKE